MEYQLLRPSQVLLDFQNPRLPDGASSDKDAINRLLGEGFDQLVNLARDMVTRGESNPTELPIVIREGAKFVVLEGNRRFAALKLIEDPFLADDLRHRAAFERVVKNGKSVPESIWCAIARNRDEADIWITLRHTGENSGVGVRTWSAQQTALHRKRMKAPIDTGTMRAIAIADELIEAYQADHTLVELIGRVREKKLTNIGRFFSNDVLTRLQLELRPSGSSGVQALWAKHSAGELYDFFMWAFSFLEMRSVDAFKNASLRGNRLNEASHLLPLPTNAMEVFQRLADRPYVPKGVQQYSERPDASPGFDDDRASGQDDRAGATGGRTNDDDIWSSNGNARNGEEALRATGDEATHDGNSLAEKRESNDDGDSRAADGDATGETGIDSEDGDDHKEGDADDRRRPGKGPKDERCLFSKVNLSNLDVNVRRLLREIQLLPIEDNYAVACVLARVIVELAVSDQKVLEWSGKSENHNLKDKIKACIYKLDPNAGTQKARKDLVQAHLAVENDGFGVQYMHQFIHNPTFHADPKRARVFSGIYTPFLNSLNEVVQ